MNEPTDTSTSSEQSQEDLNALAIEENELESLKHRANLMGITYHPSIGVAKLREKVEAALSQPEPEEPKVAPKISSINKNRHPALALVRVRITCMDPSKKEFQGEIFGAGNSEIGTVKKFIPFEAPTHVPQIILNSIKERKYQTFVTEKTRNGVPIKKGKLVRAFAIEELPPLTEKELQELKQRQLMASGQAVA